MRRFRFVALGVLSVLIVSGAVVVFNPMATRSEDDRSIPVYVSGHKDTAEERDCRAPRRSKYPVMLSTKHVVVIENAEGHIVGTRALGDFEESEIILATTGSTDCVALIFIPVPDSDFYRVLVDDSFVSVITGSDLPLKTDDPSQVDDRIPWLVLDQDS